MTTTNYISELQNLAQELNCSLLASNVLEDPEFLTCSGSSSPVQHHFGPGGLVKHTWEVVLLVLQALHFRLDSATCRLDADKKKDIIQQAFLASLFHDFGKIRAYNSDAGFKTPHEHQIGHVTRSAILWETCATKAGYPQASMEQVTHAILAHHGQPGLGSPVTPKTLIAWTLHACNLLSARSDEYVRL